MEDESLALLERYVETRCDRPISEQRFFLLEGWDVAEVLFSINDIFRPIHGKVASLAYDPSLERAADDAIERFVFHPYAATWSEIPLTTWRVLLERHLQALTLVVANELTSPKAGVLPIPEDLEKSDWLGVAMIFYHYKMKLPFPVLKKGSLALPDKNIPGSPWAH